LFGSSEASFWAWRRGQWRERVHLHGIAAGGGDGLSCAPRPRNCRWRY